MDTYIDGSLIRPTKMRSELIDYKWDYAENLQIVCLCHNK